MSFSRIFFRTLPLKPRRALIAAYWFLTGRRVRARNQLRIALAQSPKAYCVWIKTIEADRIALASSIASLQLSSLSRLSDTIFISVVSPTLSVAQRAALDCQGFANWEWVPRYEAAKGRWLLPLVDGALPAPDALLRFAEVAMAHPQAYILYADHDQIDSQGHRSSPWFKPEWNEDLFLAQDYLTPACAILRESLCTALAGDSIANESGFYSALLAITKACVISSAPPPSSCNKQIVHIPHVLIHLTDDYRPCDPAQRCVAVNRHLASMGASAVLGPFASVRINWPLPEPSACPLVSIIVPTRDRLELLRCSVGGALSFTDYPNFEIIIVDNASQDIATLNWLCEIAQDPRVRVLRDEEDFNFSRLNNQAVAIANGEYICLLNNDIEILHRDWLSLLMRQARRVGIGAVGARLVYDDGSIQHAGVVIGMGDAAGHAHRFLKEGDEGYFAQAYIARTVSAVTAACLVVAKEKFLAVGGFDEQNFAVAFNDVDLCLKLGAAGWRNVYEPAAVLIHHESISRGKDTSRGQISRYRRELGNLQQRWKTKGFCDPQFHPNLDPTRETYMLML